MSRIIAVGQIEKEEVRHIRYLSEKLRIKSPTVKILVGDPRKLRRYIPNSDENVPKMEREFSKRGRARGIYMTEPSGRKNSPPVIVLREYDPSVARHELCHLKEEELGWDLAPAIATTLSQDSATKKKSELLLGDMNECVSDFFVKDIAARYGFAHEEFDLTRGKLEKSLKQIINGRKEGRKYLERPSAGTSLAMFLALETSWKPFGRFINVADLRYMSAQAATLMSYFREEAQDMLPLFGAMAERIDIPPSYMNLFNIYRTFINIYESVVDAQKRMSATERRM